MKYPINTAQDDFGIVFKGNKEEGLLSSTRRQSIVYQVEEEGKQAEEIKMRSKGKEDIFYFILPDLEYDISATITDANTGEPVSGAKVQIIGSDGTDIEVTTGDDGIFKYNLKQNTDYLYIVRKKGYLHGKGRASTKNMANSKHFNKKIILARIGESIKIDDIYYDFGKWELRNDAKKNLQQLIDILNDNPNIVIELSSHTDMVGDEKTNLELPDEFLKRWIIESNQKEEEDKRITPEELEAQYDNYRDTLRWQIIEEKISEKYGLRITNDEIKKRVGELLGLQVLGDDDEKSKEIIDQVTESVMQNRDEVNKIADQIMEQKLVDLFEEKAKITHKKTGYEDFVKMVTDKVAAKAEKNSKK
jgi:hypothetical protein